MEIRKKYSSDWVTDQQRGLRTPDEPDFWGSFVSLSFLMMWTSSRIKGKQMETEDLGAVQPALLASFKQERGPR